MFAHIVHGMSCQVMYQSHYSYFPYQRNIIPEANKQGIAEHDLQQGGAREPGTVDSEIRNSPNAAAGGPQYPGLFERPSNFVGTCGANTRQQTSTPSYTGGQSYPATNQSILGLPGFQTRENQPVNHSHARDNLPPLVRGIADDKVKGEKDKEGMEEEDQKNAQYLSANCVIFTYYSGDISKVVDDHFSKALSQSNDRDSIPLSARNLPPSFWDSSWVRTPSLPASTELYSADPYSADPWHNYMAAQMAVGGSYSAHQMYTARSYSSLLLQSRREWVEQNYSSSPYASMTGLDGGMQGSAKDLYWF